MRQGPVASSWFLHSELETRLTVKMTNQSLALAELLRLNSLSTGDSGNLLQYSGSSTWSKRRREKLLELKTRFGFGSLESPSKDDFHEATRCCFCDSFSSPCSASSRGVSPALQVFSGLTEHSSHRASKIIGRRTKFIAPRRLSTDLHGLEDVTKFWAACGKSTCSKLFSPAVAFNSAASISQNTGSFAPNRTCSPVSECMVSSHEEDIASIAHRLDFGADMENSLDQTSLSRQNYPDEDYSGSKLHFVRGRKRGRILCQHVEEALLGAHDSKTALDSPEKIHGESFRQQSLEACTPEKNRFGVENHGLDLSFGDSLPYSQDIPLLQTPEKPISHQNFVQRSSATYSEADIHDKGPSLTKAVQTEHEAARIIPKKRSLGTRFANLVASQREREIYLAKRSRIEFRSSESTANGRRKRMRVLRFWRGETVEYSLNERLRFPTLNVAVIAPASPRDMLPSVRRRFASEAPKSGFRAFCQSRVVSPERAAFYNDILPRSTLASP
ncbi:hypothetical protein CCYA_CCYA02G0604 [Cyanidiococcus yangmingshanensis]|nr:hypothetical protein CCYA_CCYA02G0604 [Cyanidiococcus yangmingshanensis]